MLHLYRKRTILLMLAFLLLTIVPAAQSGPESGNLLENGGFEMLDGNGLPEAWFTDAYRMEPGYSLYSVTTGMEGKSSAAAEIRNTTKNDARFAQEAEVEPDSLYCLSGYIRAEGITEGHGANLSIEGVYAFSESVFDTEGEWQYIEYYGETGPDQYSVTVFARVGGYSGESRGTAAFDNVKLEKVDTLPVGVSTAMMTMKNRKTACRPAEWPDRPGRCCWLWDWCTLLQLPQLCIASGTGKTA